MINRKYITYILLVIIIIAFPLGINYLKNQKINSFKTINQISQVKQSEIYLKTLIKEKQNTTSTIATGLANNDKVINTLKDSNNSELDLANYSLHLRNTTDFKNVWFQLITKDGISIQRSWTDYKGDDISKVRKDIQKLLKEPKPMKSISVGKFDMTFKSMTPVYEDGKFLGIIEVITHFNSISKKLAKDNIKLIVLADKRYKKQVIKPFTQKFVDDYYVANFDADNSILNHLKLKGVENYISNISSKTYFVDEDTNSLVSYYSLESIDNKPMAHFLMFYPMDKFNSNKVTEIKDFYNMSIILTILVLILLFYFTITIKVEYKEKKQLDFKILILILFAFVSLAIAIYYFMNSKYQSELEFYKTNVKKQTLLEYNSIMNRNQDISELIYTKQINSNIVKRLIKERKREELYNYLLKSYKDLKINYNVRQLHFHLPDSTSFLRMHRPNRYGDSLKGIRESVEYVNREKLPYHGFEEGRIYNGFRHVYPITYNKEHIGSVEISFDVYSIIETYLNTFNSKRINFLISKEIIDEKVFENEKSNYLKSPLVGFYLDKLVMSKLKDMGISVNSDKKDPTTLKYISNEIKKGKPFIVHFDKIGELTVLIPLRNDLNGKVIATINISKKDEFIQKREEEFLHVFITVFLILGFIMAFIYREVLLKVKFNAEFDKNQTILDSQKSFIIITDGKTLKASNKSMLEFFGFNNLDEFKSEYDCICDKFENVEGNYIRKQMGELNWFEYIKNNKEKENLVQMTDLEGYTHIFYIEFDNVNKIDIDEYVVSFIDITNLKQVEQQLIHSEKMASLGNMIGNISHQWRQPLSVISTAASGIKAQKEFGYLDDKMLVKNMDTIVNSAQFLSETIDTFTEFIKEGKELKDQVVQEVLDKTLKIVDASLKNNHINFINDIDYTFPIHKKMALGELSQVITNLINNAKDVLIQRDIENPTITISCKEESNKIVIYVLDNGGGVDEEIIDKIFEPYFTTKHQSVGTGLGLYMSHKIILESLKGNLYVQNTQGGAKFIIEIPI